MQSSLNRNQKIVLAAGIFTAGVAAPYLLSFLNKIITKVTSKKQPETIKKYGAVQMGGTNYKAAKANVTIAENGSIKQITITDTVSGRVNDQDCDQTMDEIGNFFGQFQYDFIGIASFGPICLYKQNPSFGSITSTPKLSWRNYPILQKIQQRTKSLDYGFDTDVNAPAMAEFKLGEHGVKESLVYVTVGTGVGVGVVANGNTIHGLMHPEGGHIIVQRHPQEWEGFKSVCPYHENCLQGFVTNNAIAKRYQIEKTEIEKIGEHEKIWRLIGYYLAQLCYNITLLISPEIIVIGGGIMNSKIIFDYIYEYFPQMLNKYVDHPKLKDKKIAEYIRAPTVENLALKGAMMLSSIK